MNKTPPLPRTAASGDPPYGSRVYSYVDEQGHTYYSFHRSEGRINIVNRLELKDRQGEFYAVFLTRLRRVARMFITLKRPELRDDSE